MEFLATEYIEVYCKYFHCTKVGEIKHHNHEGSVEGNDLSPHPPES